MNGDSIFGGFVAVLGILVGLAGAAFVYDAGQRDIMKQCRLTGTAVVGNHVIECKMRSN